MKKQSEFLRRFTALALILCMLAALTAEIFAADIIASGYCGGEGDGTNLTWTLDTDGKLKISGTGKMLSERNNNNQMPWLDRNTSIKAIIIDNGVTSIEEDAFWGCVNCSSISIPSSVTSIGYRAFGKCQELENIVIPNGVKKIETDIFYGCKKLTGIFIPDSVTSIAGSLFGGECPSLISIIVDEKNPKYDSRNNCNAIIDSETNVLLSGCQNTIIPDGIVSIGKCAFSDCDSLKEIDIPSSVLTIEELAFRSTGLTNVIIPDSVTVIGRGAFASCSFTSVIIPSSVTSIGDYAFEDCKNLTDVIISDGVTDIGNGAFQLCKRLTSVIIPASTKRIGMAAFNFDASLKSVIIPNSVTSIGERAFRYCYNLQRVILSDNMTTIAGGTFYDCRSLTDIRIPDGVKSIGGSAFAGCKSITSVMIPSSVTDIGDYAFSGALKTGRIAFLGNAPTIGNHTFGVWMSSTVFYYIQGKTGWTDSSAYDASAGTWNGFPLKTWNGKSLPAEAKISVPKDKYCIQVIDETGAPVSDADVTWNDAFSGTDQEGKVFFDLYTVGNPVIHVSKTGYTTWSNENSDWQKNDKRFEQVILYPESYGGLKLKTARIGNCDLLTQTKVLNLRNDGASIGDLNSGYFKLSCKATKTSEVVGYAVYQNTKKIAESLDGTFSKLDVRDFAEGGGCFVRVTDKAGKTVDTHINLQFAKNSVNESFKFELKGNKISFDVSDDIPYVGGSSIGFELPITAPVVVSATSEKLQLGINLNLTSDKTADEQVADYIKTIKKIAAAGGTNLTKANAKVLKNCAAQHNKAEFLKDFDLTFCGYAEADLGSNTFSGYVYFIVESTLVDLEYNTAIWVIPITIQVDMTFSLEAGGMVSYRSDTRTWNGNVFLNPSIGLSPFIGIGFSDAFGGGAYGSAELSVGWNAFETNSGLQNVDLTGELGMKAYAGGLEWHKAFAHQTWHIYAANTVKSNSLLLGGAAWNAEPTASDFTPSDLSYLAAESDWAPAAVQTYAAARAAQLKASYQPLLRGTYRNAQPVMVSDGSALYAAFVRADPKTGARYIALTKFDGNSWSEPVRVDASAILDDAPQLCTDGQTLWLAYARTTQEPGNSLVSYAQHQNIVVGTVNKDTLAFTEQKTYQSDNYMRLPTLSCVNGTPVLAWAESAVTDQESVVNPATSTVYTAEFRSGAWPDARKAADTAGVDSFCIGAQNGTAAIAYISDGTLYCGGRVLAENVIGRAVYGRLPSADADSFIWNADGALHDEAGNTVPVEGLGRDFVIVGDSIYFNQSNGANANLAALHYDAANQNWSAPILLIGDKQYLENLNAAELNGKTYALGMHTTVTITADDVDDAKDLVWTQILPVSDLKLSDVSFDADALVPGETLPVTFTVTNSGDHTVNSLTLTANGVNTAQDCQLLPGKSAEFTVNLTCPSEKQTVTFEVQEPGQDDYTPEDNTAACTVGSADAEVELALLQIGSRKFLQASVVNRGLEPASGSVLFTGPDGQTLAERTFQNLTYGGTVIAEYEPDSFAALYGEDVTATVRLQQDEPNMLNNTDSVPVLLTSTEILSAQRTGDTVTAEIACMQDGARTVCAFYAADGRLLSTAIQTLQSGKTNSLSFTISDPNAAYAKLFVLDAKSAPAAAGKTVPLNG